MDIWHEAVLNECMKIEGAYKSDDPVATLKALIDWHCQLAVEDLVSVWELVKIRDHINETLVSGASVGNVESVIPQTQAPSGSKKEEDEYE